MLLQHPWEPNALLFALRPTFFKFQAILRQVHWITPKWHWILKDAHYLRHKYNRIPNFTPFRSTAIGIVSCRPFWDKCTKLPQNDLEHYTWYIYMVQLPQSPKFLCFDLRLTVFKLQAILRQVHPMTPKSPWTLKGQWYPIYMLELSLSPKFHFVSKTASHRGKQSFQVTGILGQVHQTTLNTKRSKVPHTC